MHETVLPSVESTSDRRRAAGRAALAIVTGFGVLLLTVTTWESLTPYILGLTLAYLLLPLVRWFESRLPTHGRLGRFRHAVATLLTFVVLVIFAAILATILLDPIVDQTKTVFGSLTAYWNEILAEYPTFRHWYEDVVPIDIQVWMQEHLDEVGRAALETTVDMLRSVVTAFGGVLGGFLALVMVPLFVVYFVLDLDGIDTRLRRQLPDAWTEDAVALVAIFNRIFGSYTRGVIFEAILVGFITGFGYWAIGVELWAALGVIAFAGEIVPILGPWIAFFISFPVVLATQPEKAIPAVALFGIIQLLEGWIIAPRIQGHSVDFSASASLVILAIGGALGGGLGVVISMPTAAIIRAILVYADRRLSGMTTAEAVVGIVTEVETSEDNTAFDLQTEPGAVSQ
jgi:predicted PurR-regulated permease PerM